MRNNYFIIFFRPVTVMRFISKNSIEENIYQVALEKLSLEREISSEGKTLFFKLKKFIKLKLQSYYFFYFAENEHSEMKNVATLLKKVLGLDGIKPSPLKKPT